MADIKADVSFTIWKAKVNCSCLNCYSYFIKENAIADQEFWPYEENEDYVNNDDNINVTSDPFAKIWKICHNKEKWISYIMEYVML